MVKIAVAGGSGQVGQEVIDTLVASEKHEIVILSRDKAVVGDGASGVTWRAVDYDNKSQLIEALQGIHTVLFFIQLMADPENTAQKNLIDAAIVAGVKRFAPSEWGRQVASTIGMPWWSGKDKIKEYLEKVNENGKVLEYTLFQPGLFLEYLAAPYKTVKHLEPLNTMIDFQNRRAIVVDGYDAIMTFTTVKDLTTVVVLAVDLAGEWPVVEGIRGNRVLVSEVLKIGEKVRGRTFAIEKVKLADLEKGILTASWTLEASHPSVKGDQVEKMLKTVLIGTLLSSAKGAWDVSDEMNQLLPDFKFTQIEDFLTEVWDGKP
ncbi:NAD(P)-binding protein [Hyaloscypha hepaticicola]|uniref:NAD(P)-binding protein n=1 Tax=Hyaloscypha hepaticicola TaxID=2082293 RepID=A0A2J6QFR5_9HELO|nr:NAD(P)-binding protein [Hyaloscypha hepaticicola]